MRSILLLSTLAVIFCLCLVSSSANPTPTTNEAIERAAGMLKNTLHRAAKLQGSHFYMAQALADSSSGGSNNAEKCKKLSTDLVLNCVSKEELEGGLSPTLLDKLCLGSCFTTFKGILSECLGDTVPAKDIPTAVAGFELACSTGPDGKRCGQFMFESDRCTNATTVLKNETACGETEHCRWDAKAKNCTASPTIVCEPCMQKVLRLNDPTGSLVAATEMMCYQAPNGSYCLDVVLDSFTESSSGIAPDFLEGLCTDASKYVCLSKLGAGTAIVALAQATTVLNTCMEANTHLKHQQQCVDTWRMAAYNSWSMRQFANVACLSANANHYCSEALVKLNTTAAECFDKATNTSKNEGTCSDECNLWANTTINNLGCCVGFVGELRSEVLPSEFASMKAPGMPKTGIKRTKAPANVPENPLAVFNVCPAVKKANFNFTQTCPIVFAPPVTRHVVFKIRWTDLAKNNKLLKKVNATLKEDLAAAIGISSSDFSQFNISEDSDLQLAAPAAASGSGSGSAPTRFFSPQAAAETSSATRADVSFHTPSSALSKGLGLSFDSAITSDTVVLTSTQELLTEECPECIAGDNGDLLDNGATHNANHKEETSNVGLIVGLTIGAVVLVAIIAVVVVKKKKNAESEEGSYERI